MKSLSRILLFLLPAFSIVALVACSGDNGTDANGTDTATDSAADSGTDSMGGNGEPAMSLEIADLEKIDSWEQQAKAHAKLTEMMAQVMEGVSDQASAEAAIDKFKKLASQFAALNRAVEAIGEASPEDKTNALKIVGPANDKFDAAYTKLSENEELFKIVQDALDKAYVGEEF